MPLLMSSGPQPSFSLLRNVQPQNCEGPEVLPRLQEIQVWPLRNSDESCLRLNLS